MAMQCPQNAGDKVNHDDPQLRISSPRTSVSQSSCNSQDVSDSGTSLILSRLDVLAEQLACVLQWQVQVDASIQQVRDELHYAGSTASVACENAEIPQHLPVLPRLLGTDPTASRSTPRHSETKQEVVAKFQNMEDPAISVNTVDTNLTGASDAMLSPSTVGSPSSAGGFNGRRSSFQGKRALFNSLTGGRRSRQRRMKAIITAAEDLEEKRITESTMKLEASRLNRSFSVESVVSTLNLFNIKRASKARLDANVDSIAAGFICLNVVVITLSCDDRFGFGRGWFWIDFGFACVFAMELVAKLWIHGFWTFFGGESCRTNIFDSAIVALDVVQIILALASSSPGESKFLSASIFRFARLARLIRVVRAFQPYFQGLDIMIQGMCGGASTLGWASIIILIPMFVCAVLMSELAKNLEESDEEFSRYFDSVERSMFTMFRCGFGDCNNEYGQPIFEFAWQSYAWQSKFAVLVYCGFMFLIVNGLFNVVSAIFVDNVVATSVREEKNKRLGRLRDEGLFASRVTVLLRCILDHLSVDVNGKLTDVWSVITKLEVSSETFAQLIQDPQVVSALKDLDIQEADHAGLFNMLDAEKSGRLLFEELVEGLESLRGEPRRSDIVACDLMLRSVQHKVDTILDLSTVNVKNMTLSSMRRSSVI